VSGTSSNIVFGEEQRFGDRHVDVSLPNIEAHSCRSAVIFDDVASSGKAILKCIKTLKSKGIERIQCVAIYGIFAEDSDKALMQAGISELAISKTIPQASNAIDITPQLKAAVISMLQARSSNSTGAVS